MMKGGGAECGYGLEAMMGYTIHGGGGRAGSALRVIRVVGPMDARKMSVWLECLGAAGFGRCILFDVKIDVSMATVRGRSSMLGGVVEFIAT